MSSNNSDEANLDNTLTLIGFVDQNKVNFIKDEISLRYFEDFLSINLAFIKTLPKMTQSLPTVILRGAPHGTTRFYLTPRMAIGLNSFCLWIQENVWCNVDTALINIDHFNED